MYYVYGVVANDEDFKEITSSFQTVSKKVYAEFVKKIGRRTVAVAAFSIDNLIKMTAVSFLNEIGSNTATVENDMLLKFKTIQHLFSLTGIFKTGSLWHSGMHNLIKKTINQRQTDTLYVIVQIKSKKDIELVKRFKHKIIYIESVKRPNSFFETLTYRYKNEIPYIKDALWYNKTGKTSHYMRSFVMDLFMSLDVYCKEYIS